MSDYPKLLIHRGKHGDRHIFCLNREAELRGWLALFMAMDKWDEFYDDLTNEYEINWRDEARNGSREAARSLLTARDSCEYEMVYTECVITPTRLMRQINDQV